MTKRADAPPPENPLVPHAVLRTIFTRMVQARLLEEHLGSRSSARSRSMDAIRGEEACRASSVACLEAGDLVSDSAVSPAADLLLGRPLRDLLLERDQKERSASALQPQPLPVEASAREQIGTALGAAHALRLGGAKRLVLVYLRAGSIPTAFWKAALAQAGQRALPILFLVLPSRGAKTSHAPGLLSDRAMGWGVPGIAVDAVDAVALYRVLSESTARARAGDGPVLIEALAWRPAGERSRPVDPLIAIGEALTVRGVANAGWQRSVGERFSRRLNGTR